jgi:tetratricopeptide (TPR) repeat protein
MWKHADMLSYLISLRAKTDGTAGAQYPPPLVMAAAMGWMEAVKMLVEAGADPNVIGFDGATPIHVAVESGFEEIVKYLKDHGASISVEELESAYKNYRHSMLNVLADRPSTHPQSVDVLPQHAAEAEELKVQGNDAFTQNDFEGAIRLYSAAIELNPTKAVYFNNRSQCYIELQRFDEARTDAQRCLGLDSENVKAYYRLGLSYSGLKNFLEASVSFWEAYKRESHNKNLKELFEAAVRDGRAAASS